MKIMNFFAKSKEKNKNGGFANFFLHASEREKEKVFMEAARRANEDQQNLVDRLNTPQQKAT